MELSQLTTPPKSFSGLVTIFSTKASAAASRSSLGSVQPILPELSIAKTTASVSGVPSSPCLSGSRVAAIFSGTHPLPYNDIPSPVAYFCASIISCALTAYTERHRTITTINIPRIFRMYTNILTLLRINPCNGTIPEESSWNTKPPST